MRRTSVLGRAVMRAAFGVLAVVVLIALATTLRGAGSDSDPNGGGQEAAPLTVAAAVDHDPLGDGDEHPATVGLAVDGDDATEWDTEGYETPALSGLKSGVGLLLDLGEVRDVVAVEVLLGVGDVDLTVTVSDERPEGDPTASATVLATADDAPAGLVQLEGDPVSGRWVAIWFTQLGEDGSRFRAALSEVRVFGE
jgi:hypothetical protein